MSNESGGFFGSDSADVGSPEHLNSGRSISPEQLKVIAEGMGYRIIEITPNKNLLIAVSPNEGHTCGDYNPLNNAEQDRELEIKLMMSTKHTNGEWRSTTYMFPRAVSSFGDTPAEARCNAAFKYFSEVKNG